MPSESSVGVGGAAVGGQTTVGNMELPGKVTSAAGSSLVVSVVVPQAHRPALTAFVYPMQ